MIARLSALQTEVEGPDGLVRFTLGDDGRLLSLLIHDAARTSMTNLGLEKKLSFTTSPRPTGSVATNRGNRTRRRAGESLYEDPITHRLGPACPPMGKPLRGQLGRHMVAR